MTVAELIAKLNEWEPEFKVVVSHDAEGNQFSLLADIDGPWAIDAEAAWDVEVWEDHDADEAVVLWPM